MDSPTGKTRQKTPVLIAKEWDSEWYRLNDFSFLPLHHVQSIK